MTRSALCHFCGESAHSGECAPRTPTAAYLPLDDETSDPSFFYPYNTDQA